MGKMATILSVALLVLSAAATAQAKLDAGLVNVSFGNKESVPEGKAVGGADNDKWNAMDGASGAKVALTDAKGEKTDVTVTYEAAGTWDAADDGGFAGTPFAKLLTHYLHSVEARKVTLAGLTPKATYDLVVFSASNSDGRKTKFTVGKDSKTTTYAIGTKELAADVNYARFTATADADGNLEITFEGVDGEGNLNAIQLTPKAAGPAK
jgi:hypothetical protein